MEKALHEAGSCGRFQVFHSFFTQIPGFIVVWSMLLMMFGGYNPGWICTVGGGENDTINTFHFGRGEFNVFMANASVKERGSSGSLEQETFGSNNTSSYFHLNEKSGTEYVNDSCRNIKLCQENGGSINFNSKSITLVSEFNLICDREWILKVFVVIQGVGFLLGSLAGGHIGERFGRKVSMYGGQVIICIFTGIAIFSFHWMMYAACLFFIGFGTFCSLSSCHVFPLEFMNSKWRSLFYAIPIYNASLCTFTFVSTMIKNWVYVHIATCLISLMGCVGYFIIPESLRWLAVHGYQDEVDKVIRKIARINKRPPPSHDVLEKLQQEYDNSESKNVTYSYMDIFKRKRLCIAIIKFLVLCLIMYTTYYALGFGVTSLPGNFYTNLILSSVCEIIFAVASAFLCNKIGRRWTGMGMSLLAAASCGSIVVVLYTADGEVQTIAITWCAFLARANCTGMIIIATVLISEHFPTAVRSVAFGLTRSMAGVGGIISPFLIPSANTESYAVCYAVITVCYIVGMCIFLSLSETNKLCLVDKIDKSSSQMRKAEDECAL